MLTSRRVFALACVGLAVAVTRAERTASEPSAFPGANGRIVFQTARRGTFDLFSVRPDGTGVQALTSGRDCDALPAWSPDGRSIAFERTPRGRDERQTDIYLLRPGGKPRRLTFTRGFDGDPAWSPDGRFIVFESKRDGNSEIYRMLANGTQHTRLTANRVADTDPAWSPGGRKIAFTRASRAGAGDIFLMDPDGSSAANITKTLNEAEGNPAWTPGGGLVLFDRTRGGDTDIWRTDRITEGKITNADALDALAAVSPDGRSITFLSERRGRNRDIWVMNLDGSNPRLLFGSAAADTAPDWQRQPRGSRFASVPPALADAVARTEGSDARPIACVTG